MESEFSSEETEGSDFSWQETRHSRVMIYWRGREIMVLKGDPALKLASKLERADQQQQQMLLAKITGNFKRGNERKG